MLLPTAFLIGGFMLCDARFYRKDALMLLMIFLTIYLYRKHITTTTRHTITRLLLYIIGTITILTHEASFFCFVPFFLLHYCTSCKGATFTRLAKSTLFNLPFIITMALVCIFKGNMDVCQGIWHSWQPYFLTQYDTMPALGDGVRALSWNTTDTFIMHAKANFFNSVIWDRSMPLSMSPAIPNILIWVIIWAGVYYLCVNVNKVKMFAYETGEYDNHIKRVLPQLLLIQFIALLPMFTILSCDMRRVIFYWIFSTFFILSQLIPLRQQLSIPFITRIGNYLHNFFTNKRLFRSKLFYIVTLLIIGIPFGAITAISYIDSTIIFRINYLIRYFLPSIIGG